MKMLDNNLEHEPGQGSFFIRELDEEVIRQNDQHFELVQFADTEILIRSINDTASYLSNKPNPMLKSIEELNLDQKLAELKDEILNAQVVEIAFPKITTRYTSNYDLLIRAYSVPSKIIESHKTMLYKDRIKSVVVLPGQESESLFVPRVVLQVETGLEPAINSIKDGEVIEMPGQPRWYDFSLDRSRIRTFDIQPK